MINRRQAIKTAALGIAALAATKSQVALAQNEPGAFKLPALPYPFDALEPHIDARTMEIHHDRHHAAYVAGLNRAVADTPALQGKTVEELLASLDKVPESVRNAIRNHGGGHYNHALFWPMLSGKSQGQPKGELATAIERQFKGYDGFKDQFTKAALGQFGSGWAWLTMTAERQLRIESTPNQDSPWTHGHAPLLGLDVWEHAYYLKYQNRRADYVSAFFNVIDWDFVARRFKDAHAS
jgi:superoxide dismutase, Fe-Mn family